MNAIRGDSTSSLKVGHSSRHIAENNASTNILRRHSSAVGMINERELAPEKTSNDHSPFFSINRGNRGSITSGSSKKTSKRGRRGSHAISLASRVSSVFKGRKNWGAGRMSGIAHNNNQHANNNNIGTPTNDQRQRSPSEGGSSDGSKTKETHDSRGAHNSPTAPILKSSFKGPATGNSLSSSLKSLPENNHQGGEQKKQVSIRFSVSTHDPASLSSYNPPITASYLPTSNGCSTSTLRQRRMSRRVRNGNGGMFNSLRTGKHVGSKSWQEGGVFGNTRSNSETSNDGTVQIEDSLSSVLMTSLGKKSLCDVEIVGKDEVPVQVPSFLLAAHSEVFERMFYSKEKPAQSREEDVDEGNDVDTSSTSSRSSTPHKVELAFADYDAIELSIHFLVNRSLSEGLENDPSEFNIRLLCQIHLFGRLFKIHSLQNRASCVARRMMNKMPKLVCAAFDECVVGTKILEGEEEEGDGGGGGGVWILGGRYVLPSMRDELKAYALDYLRDSPMTTLLSGGTDYLTKESIEAIICDQDMDVDEHTMFHILNTWVKQDEEENVDAGKELVSHIDLTCIKSDYLNNAVKRCGFVELADVNEALKEIEEILENQSPDEKEHVLVEGAGKEDVNGIYVRMDEDIGLGEEEVMYVKEAPEDVYDMPDYGLYLMRSTWSITPCVDYSNVLYSCETNETSLRHQTPKSGWKTVNATDPVPSCTWNPSKDARASKVYVAPNLVAGSDTQNFGDIANGDHDEGARKRYTLRTMLNLPTDEGHEDDDYHDVNPEK